ncbi:MAG: transketolase [Ruminococcaceae bacterium]|nr:transketolase [Oscillospiraceae bacterium]
MDIKKKQELSEIARQIRIGVVSSTNAAGCGHPGGSLSIAEVLAWLYFGGEMKIDPKDPKWDERDRLVLSKGHAAPGLYSALALRGFFPKEDLLTLRKLGSHLQGHPNMHKTPGIDMSTGSLGQGISAACGMATAAKLDKKDYRVYAIVGDGESQEGEVWEAAMYAAHFKLDNLCAIIDLNGLQIDGKVSDVMGIEPMDKKFAAFGWNVFTCDAHDFDSVEKAFADARAAKGAPSVILSRSVKGKGVSFMENNAGWHGKATKPEEFEQAMAELEKEAQNG